MSDSLLQYLSEELERLKKEGLYKVERPIQGQQTAHIRVGEKDLINLCANNYLGLANHPALMQAASAAIEQHGYGMASVRFICGTQTIHKALETKISEFLGKEDTILYSSCFDANGGLFETLLGEEDAVISDSLNHASIIDGIRLCKAKRLRYQNNDMAELEAKLKEASSCRFKLIVTDGVFSMDGSLANLPKITELAKQYDAIVAVDDSHAVGFMGKNGRGTHEHFNVMDDVHILTGTLGKALGGASGGYISGPKPIIEWLRQRSRPYLFSNTLAPVITATSLKALELVETMPQLRENLFNNAAYFRKGLSALGFELLPGEHPIIPVMLKDAKLAQEVGRLLFEAGVYAVGFFYPVVPMHQARIRTQMSAALNKADLDQALNVFEAVGKKLNII